MVRVVEENNKGLNSKSKAVFKLLGLVVADQHVRLKKLLEAYGFVFTPTPSPVELTEAAIRAMEQNNQGFNQKLAVIMANQMVPEGFDHFEAGDLAGSSPNLTMGADPVSAIAGAVGSIFSFAGSIANKNQLKRQARQQSIQSLLMYEAEKEKAAVQSKTKAGRDQILKMAGIGIVVLLIIGWMAKKKKAVPQPV